MSFSFKIYLSAEEICSEKSKPLFQVVKRVAELEEYAVSGLYHNIIHTKYSVNKKDGWSLVTSGDFVLIEEILNEDFILMSCLQKKKNSFQNLFTVSCESKFFNIV